MTLGLGNPLTMGLFVQCYVISEGGSVQCYMAVGMCYVIFERPLRFVDPAADINIVTVCAFSTYTKAMVLPRLCKMSHYIVSLCLS